MKQILQTLLLLIILIQTACEVDPCKDMDCGTNGRCYEGFCSCEAAYELDENGRCNVMWTDKFRGRYDVETTCDTGSTITHVMSISRIDRWLIRMGNFDGSGTAITINLGGPFDFEHNNAITLDGRIIDMRGIMDTSKTTINLFYTTNHPDGTTTTCSSTAIRR